jgi:hypothetical protein
MPSTEQLRQQNFLIINIGKSDNNNLTQILPASSDGYFL